MIKRKGRLALLIVFAIVLLGIVISFTSGVIIRIPSFSEWKIEKFCVYTSDSNGDRLEEKRCISVEGGKTLEDKIDILVKELQKQFSGIELKVIGYNNVLGKKVLVLDLRDGRVSVDSYLNAGSTGSRINLGILVNSLLQNGRKVSNWIDGVKILVNGEEGVETSHVSLDEVFFRTRESVDLR